MKKTNNDVSNWYSKKDAVKTSKPIFFTLWCIKHFPKWFLNIVIRGNAIFFYCFNKNARIESKRFQKRLATFYGKKEFPHQKPWCQLASFAFNIVEKIDCWTNPNSLDHITFCKDDVQELIDRLNNKKGAFIFTSHLGESEVLRSFLNSNEIGVKRKVPAVVLADLNLASPFVNALNQMNPEFLANTINVNDITPATIEYFQETINNGGVVVCACDRISKNAKSRFITQDFLGKPAPFPYGVFFLSTLLKAQSYFVFGFKKRDLHFDRMYDIHVHKVQTIQEKGQESRRYYINKLCKEFATWLQVYCKEHPYQWYNFFNFWEFPDTHSDS